MLKYRRFLRNIPAGIFFRTRSSGQRDRTFRTRDIKCTRNDLYNCQVYPNDDDWAKPTDRARRRAIRSRD